MAARLSAHRRCTIRRSVLLAALLAIALTAPGGLPSAEARVGLGTGAVDRSADPIVLTGSDVPSLLGIEPGRLAAFRYDGGWQQIPLQVDERDIKYFEDIYQNSQPWPGTIISGVSGLVYVDPGTLTGPDSDPTLDANDEIVFMAKDAGGPALSSSSLSGAIAGTGVEVRISDPLDPAAFRYAYFFRSDGTLDPGAGQQYVNYVFNLLSGGYLETYDRLHGPNPEHSTVTTPYYSDHFSDRWINDEMRVTAGAATGVDILDRHKSLFAPGNCGRSENTFSNAEGAFIVNKSGPVRAIRSYVGANSGPLTQRDNIFYERRQDIRTYLRVHSISGIMDFFDYSPDAAGMTYYNDLNTSGVAIDGVPDSVELGPIQWEMVTGPQGSLAMASSLTTNITGLAPTSYYLDDSTPGVVQCTGDAFAYGSSGTMINQNIPCTDPAQGCSSFLRGVLTIYYAAPGLTVDEAQSMNDQEKTPLTYATAPFPATAVGGIAEYQPLTPATSSSQSSWDAKDVIIVVAAIGFVVLLIVGAFIVRRRGDSDS